MIPSGFMLGDCRAVLATLPEGCARTCITSPPYWNLRDYGEPGQIGLEETLAEFIAALVDVFRAVRRVLADDGTLWVNMGDTSAGSWGSRGRSYSVDNASNDIAARQISVSSRRSAKRPPNCKSKDLIGVPWELALALRADGWYLRQDIIWHKPNPTPDPAIDRPTRSHEYIFLLSKSPSYFYNANAIRTPLAAKTLTTFTSERKIPRGAEHAGDPRVGRVMSHGLARDVPRRRAKVDAAGKPMGANKRSVWTGAVAELHGRRWIGIDISAKYGELAARRISQRSLVLR